jgi:radical SAM superfamily enzyme YgiQ (UPF0313 family)
MTGKGWYNLLLLTILKKTMKPKIVLINPWIYDFSALNLWSRPLGLLMTAEYLSQFDIDIRFLDCTDQLKIIRRFGTGKYHRQIVRKPDILGNVPMHFARYGISPDAFTEAFTRSLPCDAVLVTSIMSYWYPGVQEVIDIVRSCAPHLPVVLGGIYATLFHAHAKAHSGADYVYSGPVSEHVSPCSQRFFPKDEVREDGLSGKNLAEVIKEFGITLNKIRTQEPYYKLGLYRSYPFAPVLTSKGCPHRCTYCASSALFSGFIQRPPSDVINELQELYSLGVRDFAFYDDALLAHAESHIKPILKEIAASDMDVRFHCPNGMHARYIDEELAYLMKESGFSTLRLSLETINIDRQQATGGKVTSDALIRAVRLLRKYGFRKEHIGVYLMYGLPGQSFSEVIDGVAFLKSLGVRINLTEFSPIPHTKCWNDLKNKGKIDDTLDPLLTNNSVFSVLFTDYGRKGIETLKLNVKQYNSQN